MNKGRFLEYLKTKSRAEIGRNGTRITSGLSLTTENVTFMCLVFAEDERQRPYEYPQKYI